MSDRTVLVPKGSNIKKLLAVTLLCGLLCGGILGYAIPNFWFKQHGETALGANCYVQYETESRGSGEIFVGNLITKIGENTTRDRLSTNMSAVNVGWISLGNATVAVTLTKLTTEYARYTATITTPSVYNQYSCFNITATYMFTETVAITACGANWGFTPSSDNNLYAAAYLQGGTALLWNNRDNLTITWVFSYAT